MPPTGVGRLRAADIPARFARRHGFALGETTRHSQLALPLPDGAAAWRAEAERAAGGGYRLVQWRDSTPEEWLHAIAVLQGRMSTDAPTGGLDLREEAWDAQRVRETDEQITRTGDGYVLTAAEHVPTGELAAFSQIMVPAHRAAVAFQYNTLVRADHRGTGLATRLLDTATGWSAGTGFRRLLLGTTAVMHAAQRFYANAGFEQIEADALPASFPRMGVDSVFFARDVT